MRKILAMVAFVFAFQMFACAGADPLGEVGQVVLQQAAATATQQMMIQGPSLATGAVTAGINAVNQGQAIVGAAVRATTPTAKKRAQSPGSRVNLSQMQNKATASVVKKEQEAAEAAEAAEPVKTLEAPSETQPQTDGEDDDDKAKPGCFSCGPRARSGGLPNSLSFRSQGSKGSAASPSRT